MSSNCIDAYMVTSHDALTHPSAGSGADANGLTGIENSMMKCVFIFNWRCIHYGFYVPPQIKNSRTEDNIVLGCTSKSKVFADMYWKEPFPLFWSAKLTPEVCQNIFDTPCIKRKSCFVNNTYIDKFIALFYQLATQKTPKE